MRNEDADDIDSGEIEIVRVAPPVSSRTMNGVGGPVSMRTPSSARPPASRAPVSGVASSRYPAPPSDRPRVFEHRQDEELTTVMPSKRGSSFPPASAQAPRSARPSLGQTARIDDEDRTAFRPNSSLSRSGVSNVAQPQTLNLGNPALARTAPASVAPPAYIPPAPRVPQMHDHQMHDHLMHDHQMRDQMSRHGLQIQTPPTVLGAHEIPPEVRAQAMAALQMQQQYPNLPIMPALPQATPSGTIPPVSLSDPPATVVTTRTNTKMLIGRPTVSWAAALVAMGVFVGLVTAVVARGDADSLIDATASFVDPSHSAARAAAAQAPAPVAPPPVAVAVAPPQPIAPPQAIAPAPVSLAVNPPAPQPAALPPIPIVDAPKADAKLALGGADVTSAAPTPEKKPPVAYAAPAPKPVWVAPRPAYHPPAPVAAAPAPEPKPEKIAAAPAPKPEKAEKPARGKKVAAVAAAAGADDSAAAEADRLAREQLEAALK